MRGSAPRSCRDFVTFRGAGDLIFLFFATEAGEGVNSFGRRQGKERERIKKIPEYGIRNIIRGDADEEERTEQDDGRGRVGGLRRN